MQFTKEEQCSVHHFPPRIQQALHERCWTLLCSPTRRHRCLCVSCRVKVVTHGGESTLPQPFPWSEVPWERRKTSISSAHGLIHRRNVKEVSYLVACNILQGFSTAETVLLCAKVLNHHRDSVRSPLITSLPEASVPFQCKKLRVPLSTLQPCLWAFL